MTSPASDVRNILTVGLAGLGNMGRGIAACFLGHGFRLVVLETNPESRAKARAYNAEALQELVERANFPREILSSWPARYVEAAGPADLAPCDFVLETIIEDESAKKSLYAELEKVLRPDVPIATNTSAIPITLLQEGLAHPERVVGMHWLQPGHVTRFLEVIKGAQTSEQAFRLTEALGVRLGKEPALVYKDIPGFVANRLGYAVKREALYLIEQGVADPQTIERCLRNTNGWYGLLVGPIRNMDLWGLPLYESVMRRLFPELSCAKEPPALMRKLIESGATGATAGRGFFEYGPGEPDGWERRMRALAWEMREIAERHDPEKPA